MTAWWRRGRGARAVCCRPPPPSPSRGRSGRSRTAASGSRSPTRRSAPRPACSSTAPASTTGPSAAARGAPPRPRAWRSLRSAGALRCQGAGVGGLTRCGGRGRSLCSRPATARGRSTAAAAPPAWRATSARSRSDQKRAAAVTSGAQSPYTGGGLGDGAPSSRTAKARCRSRGRR